MHGRTRIGLALGAAMLIAALVAGPVLAAAGPRLALSPARGASGTTVTMTMAHCATPQLWLGPGGGATTDPGTAGYIVWANKASLSATYVPASGWTAGGTTGTWTATFQTSGYAGPGKYTVNVPCGFPTTVTAIFTVR